MAATSTYKTFLMVKGVSDYEKLIDISEVPDLGSAPENLETTTLSNKMKTYIPGLMDTGSLQFSANYDHDDYAKLYEMRDVEKEFAVWLGGTEGDEGTLTPTGSEGKFSFRGKLTVFLASQGTNAVRKMTITISPSTDIEFE